MSVSVEKPHLSPLGEYYESPNLNEHRFFAQGRRIGISTTKTKVVRCRYLLTFTDQEVCNQWWTIVQQIWPRSKREDARSFAFRADNVPDKALNHSKFVALHGQWSFSMLGPDNGKSELDTQLQPSKNHAVRLIARQSRCVSCSARPSVRESSLLASVHTADPFLDNPPADASAINLAQLNQTMSGLQMLMNNSMIRIDALAEKQQMFTESFHRLHSVMESNAMQTRLLTIRQEADALNAAATRDSICRGAASIENFIERHSQDHQETQIRSKSAAKKLDNIPVVAASTRILGLVNTSHSLPSMAMLQDMQKAVDAQSTQTAALITDNAARDEEYAAQALKLQAALDQNVALIERLRRRDDAREKRHTVQFDALTKTCSKLTALCERQQQRLDEMEPCRHEVLPPPRKMNKKLVGFVYSRE